MSRLPIGAQVVIRVVIVILMAWLTVCTLRLMPDNPWGWLADIVAVACCSIVGLICVFADFDSYE